MAKKKPAPKPEKAQGSLSMKINDHSFSGEKRRGRWTFECDLWPDLAAKYANAPDTSGMVEEFVTRALGAATVHYRADDAPEPTKPPQRRCFVCNGTGYMCNVCGEAENACHCDEGKPPDTRPCDDCDGSGIASADLPKE